MYTIINTQQQCIYPLPLTRVHVHYTFVVRLSSMPGRTYRLIGHSAQRLRSTTDHRHYPSSYGTRRAIVEGSAMHYCMRQAMADR